MDNSKTITLDDAIKAARQLPEDTQTALADELMAQVEDLSTPGRPSDRQKIIKGRLANPLKAVSREAFMGMLRHYNPSL